MQPAQPEIASMAVWFLPNVTMVTALKLPHKRVNCSCVDEMKPRMESHGNKVQARLRSV